MKSFLHLLVMVGFFHARGFLFRASRSAARVHHHQQRVRTHTPLHSSSFEDINFDAYDEERSSMVLLKDEEGAELGGGEEGNMKFSSSVSGVRDEDYGQNKDLDLILTERAKRFYDPKLVGVQKEWCLLVAVDVKLSERNAHRLAPRESAYQFTLSESLGELSELVGTAGLQVMGVCIQKMSTPNARTYVGPGKVVDIMAAVNATNARTIVIDDDLTPKQQRSMEEVLASCGGADVKVLDRTAMILEIFAQHAQSREGQLQVELAQLQYRLTRGPKSSGSSERNSGAGFRGPGETKVETDKRIIRDKIVYLKRELETLGMQRDQHRRSRGKLGLPVVALVGYTNAGKSTILNRLSRAGVLAENMLFATLDSTIRRVRLQRKGNEVTPSESAASASATATAGASTTTETFKEEEEEEEEEVVVDAGRTGGGRKGQEVLLSDTVGFISKLPTDLVAAFRATLEELQNADVLIHVCDRSSPVWEKQRETVLQELDAIGCSDTPIVELWNKIDAMPDPEDIRLEAACVPIDVDAEILSFSDDDDDEGQYESGGRRKGRAGKEARVALLPEMREEVLGGGGEAGEEEEEEKEEEQVDSTGMSSWSSESKSASYENDVEKDKEGYVWSEDDEYVPESASEALAALEVETEEDLAYAKQLEMQRRGGRFRSLSGKLTAPRPNRKIFYVAASAKTGLGFDDFVSTLEDALSLRLRKIDVFIPYNKDDGLIAMIHTQGIADEIIYGNAGTFLSCRVPPELRTRLRPFASSKEKQQIVIL